MGKVCWTEDQLRAIESRDGTLLVSAAAGSGKTAVLVERLLRRVERDGADIDRFLMITYTNAAASELRAKIIDAIAKRLADAPDDRRMARQARIVHRAKISTIHAYCTQVLRTHGHLRGIADDFKIMDEGEAEALRRQALCDLLEEEYGAARPEFLALCDALCGERDDRRLEESVLLLHQKSRSHPDPAQWLWRSAAAYDMAGLVSAEQTIWGREILAHARAVCEYLITRIDAACAALAADSALEAAYAPALCRDRENLRALEAAQRWDDMVRGAQTMEFMRLSGVRNCESPELRDWIKAERNDVKREVGKLCERLLCKDSAPALSELRALHPAAQELCRLAGALEERYHACKLRRGVLDYNDLEHEAVALLVEKYDEERDIVTPTALARELSQEFCEIMVDEYQDANCVQDILFRAVSRGEQNLTMVGDLKQSIYRFRLADPTIFLRKYKTFLPYEDAQPGQARVVNLSRNFRSRAEVLQSCNDYFSCTMSEQLGELAYTEREFLNPGAAYPEAAADYRSELMLLDLAEERAAEEELLPSAREMEARCIAARISALVREGFPLAQGAAQYGDIVILLRSLSGRAEVYERALREYGIPCVSDKSEGLLGTVEVGIMLSFLQTIDNPLWDVPLVSTLRSPMFGFTADELAEIRRHKAGFFCDALRACAKGETDCARKCAAFLQLLSELRAVAGELPVDELLWRIYDRTGARGLFGAMEEGQSRVAHLLALYQYAQRFEAGGFRGLHAFLDRVAHVTEQGGDIDAGQAEERAGAVRIMSIHKSKGLEFPIVFLADCNRRFNRMDLQEPVLTHPALGLGLMYRDQALRYECPSLARICISLALEREMKSEELRILYVGMTRAKEKLILACTERDAAARLTRARMMAADGAVSPMALLHAAQTDLWFLLPECARPSTFMLRELGKDAIAPPAGYLPEQAHAAGAEPWRIEALRARFSFQYPFADAVNAEGKLTATGLSHEGMTRRRHFARPQFMQERGLTPTERGIALHLAMQLIDYARTGSVSEIEGELSRLRAQEFFTDEQVRAVSAQKLFAFFTSELGRRALASRRVLREFHFSRLVPAGAGSSALLQGVVDLMFEENGALVLIDFKSDRQIREESVRQYTRQLAVYAEALEAIMQQPVSQRALFFLQSGRTIFVDE